MSPSAQKKPLQSGILYKHIVGREPEFLPGISSSAAGYVYLCGWMEVYELLGKYISVAVFLFKEPREREDAGWEGR